MTRRPSEPWEATIDDSQSDPSEGLPAPASYTRHHRARAKCGLEVDPHPLRNLASPFRVVIAWALAGRD